MIIAQLSSCKELGKNIQFHVFASMLVTYEVELREMFGIDSQSLLSNRVEPVVDDLFGGVRR